MANNIKCLRPTRFGSCGKCVSCKLRRQREWVLRMLLEAHSYDSLDVTFFTLTYKPECLPADRRAAIRSIQLFNKRLRMFYKDREIRYVAALETGSSGTCRYHWHCIYYGLHFDHALRHFLPKIWGNGFVDIKLASPGRMHYITKYVVKDDSAFLMSTKPGVGARLLPELKRSLSKLSEAELYALRGPRKNLDPSRASSPLSVMCVGGYYYPVHRYLKDRLRIKPGNYSAHLAQAVYNQLWDIRHAKKAS